MHRVLDVLHERGFIKDISDEAGLRQALAQPLTAYCGFDPTAPSLHVGHLLQIMVLAHLQRAGHQPIAVVGGGTGMVGDPTGKTAQRQMLTIETVRWNAERIHDQLNRFMDFSDGNALMVNNADWLLNLGYIEFLRNVGRRFSVNQMLQHETYRERVAGDGLNFVEFNYVLLQAYDYLHLFQELGCRLQIGGADQWFNILAGVDLIRRVTGEQAYAFVTPLLTTASGAKMGKTESGAVWLDPTLTTPYDYYQYWVNTEDDDVERFLKLFTFLPMDEILRLSQLEGAELRTAKETLALEATWLCHGEDAAREALAASRALFAGEGDLSGAPTSVVPAADLAAGIPASVLFVLAGLCDSRSQAKRLIEQGGAAINGDRVGQPDERIDDRWLQDGQMLLRAGKKRYRRVVTD